MIVIVTFLLQLAVGCLIFLIPSPRRDLRRSFFWTNALIAGIALGLAAILQRTASAGATLDLATSPLFWAVAAGTVAYFSFALSGRLDQGWWLLWITAAAGVLLLFRVSEIAGTAGEVPGLSAMHAANSLVGSLLIGSVVVTMNLGHWYLISSNLSFKWLVRFSAVFAGLVLLRAFLLAGFLGYLNMDSGGSPWIPAALSGLLAVDGVGVFTVFRVLAGILIPFALSAMIFATARMRSNQSCTGLLYVALFLVVIGELTGGFLSRATAIPL